MIDAIILDTETTDAEDDREVIELAWSDLNGPGAYWQRYLPTKGIGWGAMATHHIFPQELEGCPPSSQAGFDIPAATFLIGHKVDFDWEALGRPEGRRICTLAMSREIWPEVDSHTLTAMTYFTQGATEETRKTVRGAHGAAADVLLCKKLLAVIMSVTKITDLERLWAFSEEARIPKIMAFGKYKGEPISAVDRGYMNWYRKQPDTDPYVLEAFRRNGM